ncbi:MAG: hypothetical protein EOM91_13050 [Sphingobacteriia bacterium]|nr:hypothetical protein [Sphingobacteriia bacterium]
MKIFLQLIRYVAWFVAASFLIGLSVATAGPFGFEFGENVSIYQCPELPGNPGYYKCIKAPKPHSAFESYVLKASNSHGICWIKAIGRDINDNSFGSSTKAEVNNLASQLEKKYGSSEISR